MSSAKSYPPSERRCVELRARGVVPYSPELTSAGVIGGAALGIWWFVTDALSGVVQLSELLFRTAEAYGRNQPEGNSILFTVRKTGELFLLGSIQLMLPVLILGLGTHLWQSGFIPRFLRPRRLRRQRGDRRLGVALVAGLSFLGVVFLCVAPALNAVMGVAPREGIREALWSGKVIVFDSLSSLFQSFLGACGGVAFVIGGATFIAARVRFLRRYAMSREELLAEAREDEMRPETRQFVHAGYSEGGADG